MNMGAFQDFVRGLAASSDRLPQAMQVRWQREQAEKAAAQADADRQRQLVLQRLGLFIQAAQGGANVSPSPEVERLLGESLQRPTEPIPGSELAAVPGTEMEQFAVPATTERATPWNEVFRPNDGYISTTKGVFKKTKTGLELVPETEAEPNLVPLYADDAIYLRNPKTGELTNTGKKPRQGSQFGGGTQGRMATATQRLLDQLNNSLITPEQFDSQLALMATTLGVKDTPEFDSSAYTGKVDIAEGEKKRISQAMDIQKGAIRVIGSLQDPKVRAKMTRFVGWADRARRWMQSEGDSDPDLLDMLTTLGLTRDQIVRLRTGAAVNKEEDELFKAIVGTELLAPDALQARLEALIDGVQQTIDSIYETSFNLKYQGNIPDDAKAAIPVNPRYDNMPDATLARKAKAGDKAAERILRKRGVL